MHCVTVIQARRNSTRLPDKVLKTLGNKPVLHWVIERCQRIPSVDKVICAVPEGTYNDILVDEAVAAGAAVSRGSETDVLSRYWGAVKDLDTEYVMRVTSDCPLLDPDVCQGLLDGVVARGMAYGATAGFPHGLDCEVFRKSLLQEAYETASHPLDREHVTLWIKRKMADCFYSHRPEKNYQETYRWVLDYPEDYEYLQQLVVACSVHDGWRQIVEDLEKHPRLAQINADCIKDWQSKNRRIYEDAKKQA